MDISVNEHVKSKQAQAQNIQEIWHIIKRSNLGIEEEEETQVKGTENNFNKIIDQNP